MSDDVIDLVLPAKERLIDDFAVGRVLPTPVKRTVGPFIFFDHIGPAALASGRGLDVRPHPHINLSTVTYLFEGEILHRDSLGSEQVINPGAINWMTAGHGIVHSERSPQSERARGPRMHGLQLWVAMPESAEEVAPSFVHHPSLSLPELDDQGVRVRVLAGEAFGTKSPVEVHSPLVYVDFALDAGARIAIPSEAEERGVYIVDGDVSCNGKACTAHTMLILRQGAEAIFAASTKAHFVLVGGAKLESPRYIWWNFVSSKKERIEHAAREWKAGNFPKVPNDSVEFIPLNDEPRF